MQHSQLEARARHASHAPRWDEGRESSEIAQRSLKQQVDDLTKRVEREKRERATAEEHSSELEAELRQMKGKLRDMVCVCWVHVPRWLENSRLRHRRARRRRMSSRSRPRSADSSAMLSVKCVWGLGQ